MLNKLFFMPSLFLICLSVSALELPTHLRFPTGEFIVDVPEKESLKSMQKVVGSADFEKIRDFPSNSDLYKLSNKIGFVLVKGGELGVCSGSLVGPDLFLTNEHCAFHEGKPIPANEMYFSFEYYQDPIESIKSAPIYRANQLLKYNAKLDYALYRLDKPAGDRYGWLKLETEMTNILQVSSVKVIQHPAGRSKEIARKNNQIYNIYPNNSVVHYFADTESGSSGSPVFSTEGDKIIALHHAGYNNQHGQGAMNEGVLAPFIYREIQQFLPSYAEQPAPQPAKPKPSLQPPKNPAQPKPKPPVAPKPTPTPPPVKKVDCEGKGMAVSDENGNIKCVKW